MQAWMNGLSLKLDPINVVIDTELKSSGYLDCHPP